MIEVKHLTKRYGDHTAVSDLSFTIQPGQIYGFLGPNGAGKSTTMNIITGCLAATSGQVSINGHDIFEESAQAKACIGYLPEQPPVYPDMTPGEYLDFVAKAKGIPPGQRKDQIRRVMEMAGVTLVQDRLIQNLSKGYRQRVGIAQALLGDPDIIILDEPTVGLDPKQIIEIRDLIRKLGEHHTVILSSHILSEVRAVCDQILIISQGKLVANDTPEKLEVLFAGAATLDLTVRASQQEAAAILERVPGIQKAEYASRPGSLTEIRLTGVSQESLSEPVFFAFAEARCPILSMQPHQVSLEDVFLQLTQERPKDSGKKKRRSRKPAPQAAAQELAAAEPDPASEQEVE